MNCATAPNRFRSGSFTCETVFDYDGKTAAAAKAEADMAAPGFWDNQELAQQTVAQLKSLRALLKPLD
jgi:hypothetical protein